MGSVTGLGNVRPVDQMRLSFMLPKNIFRLFQLIFTLIKHSHNLVKNDSLFEKKNINIQFQKSYLW
jgi:hypothetical protein